VIDRSAFDEAVKVMKDTGHRLGAALVDLGHLDEEKLNEQVTEQIKSIIFSAFEWEAGQFAFERLETPVEEDIIVGLSTADTILEGIRRMKSMDTIRQSLGQLDRVLAHPENPLLMYQKFSLTPEEGFVMSRVDGTTTVAEAAALSPMGEEETLRCIYGLVCAGVLTLQERAQERTDRMRRPTMADEAKLPSPEAEIKEQPAKTAPVADKENKDSGPSPEQQAIKDEIAAKHASLKTANHYELLEVDPTANEAQIKEAYYAMVKKYHPDRHHSPHFEDLHGLLEDLMVKVTAAHQLLSTPADRTQYDRTLRSNEASSGQSPFVDDPDVTTATPKEMAEKHYREGKRLFNEMAYFDAIQCLQEAVRLEPKKASYHKLLADCLSKNPHWRKDAESHFLKALNLDGSDVECYLGLATIYDELGLTTRSQNTYRKILELDPDNELAQMKVHGKKKSGGLMGLLRKKA
jgi:tetratricopeptide (TPR) repeat protein